MINAEFKRLLSTQFKSHPWHGVSPGPDAPSVVRAYIEILPTSPVKLELDKATGHLHVDRPQRFSSMCPMLYGFIPQTYCGDKIAQLCMRRTRLQNVEGDGDPLDIVILTERDFVNGDLLLKARPIGGLRMVDKNQADDKIVAVLDSDVAYGKMTDIRQVPEGLIERLEHYFLSYKRPPMTEGQRRRRKLQKRTRKEKSVVQIHSVYGHREAEEVIKRSMTDYVTKFGTEDERLEALKALLVNGVIEELQARGLVLAAPTPAPAKKRR